MQHHNCQNCGAELKGAYCHQCGQKSDTHRLTMRHFIEHDLVHGIWHLDKGIFKTLKEVIIRPGYLAKEYIAGKRTGHFNLVTMLVLLATAFLFTTSHTEPQKNKYLVNDRDASDLLMFASKYGKWLLLLAIPIMAKAAGDVLKRLQYNYAERLVMSGYFIAGALRIMILFRLLYQIPGFISIYSIILEILIVAFYWGFAYRQVTKGHYTPARSTWLSFITIIGFIGYLLGVAFGGLVIYILVRG